MVSGTISIVGVAPYYVNKPIAISTSDATGGTGTITYKIEVGSEVVSDYSSTKSVNWTATTEGTYTVKVTAKDTVGKIDTATKQVVIEKEIIQINPLIITSFSTSLTSPRKAGTPITLSASGTGEGEVSYKFTVSDGTTTTTVKNFSTTGSAVWTPTKAGTYKVIVAIKDSTTRVVYRSTSYTITAAESVVVSKITTDKVSPQVAGTPIKITATAVSSQGSPLTYKFTVHEGLLGFKTIKDYSSLNSATWTPTGSGLCTIVVEAKDALGNRAFNTLTYNISAQPIAISKFTASVVSPQKTGTAITLNAVGTGIGTVNYKFTVSDGTIATVVKNFSTTGSAVWTPTKAGTYKVVVALKDSTNKVVFKTINYEVLAGEPVVISKISTDKVSPQAAGTAIKITAAAVSSEGSPLTYKFTVYEGLAGFKTIRDFSSVNYVTWTPTGTGVSTIFVEAKDALGNRTIQTITYNITAQVSKVNFNDTKIQYVGTWNTLTTGKSTNQEGASMSFSFTGNSIQLVADKGSDKGVAIVTIDGVQSEVDLYSATAATGAIVFSKTGLSSGTTHTIKIESFGISNANASNTVIKINSFNIANGTIK